MTVLGLQIHLFRFNDYLLYVSNHIPADALNYKLGYKTPTSTRNTCIIYGPVYAGECVLQREF